MLYFDFPPGFEPGAFFMDLLLFTVPFIIFRLCLLAYSIIRERLRVS